MKLFTTVLLTHLLGLFSCQGSQYVDFLPGTLNVILSSPHGGSLEPSSILTRVPGCWQGGECVYEHDCGSPDSDECPVTTVKDMYTQELARELREALFVEFGEYPPTVINLLHRRKHDANREVNEATLNVPEVVAAWNNYHGLMAEARNNQTGPALVIDIHGHGHPNDWAELGYLISKTDLDSATTPDPADSSIRNLASITSFAFEELLRGPASFGGLLEDEGFESVPSPLNLGPDGASYFTGGYITKEYGSRDSGFVDAIQIESPRVFRDQERPEYVAAITRAVRLYFAFHHPSKK